MRKGILAVGAFILSSVPLFAQTLLPPVSSSVADATVGEQANSAPVTLPAPAGVPDTDAPAIIDMRPTESGYRVWAHTDYLLWWVKNAPLPVPLVTTGDPSVGFPLVSSAGAIGQPSTRILYGDSNAGFGAFSGMRLTLGAWCDTDQAVGVEGSGFLLENRTSQFAAGSNSAGNPSLYIPAFNAQAGAERALPVSDPLRKFSGDVAVASSLQLWGAELNGLLNLWRRPGLEANLLIGFRYAGLSESLLLHNSTTDLLFDNTTVLNDHFDTENQFFGGQLGYRLSWQRDRFFLDMTAKVALGDTYQVVNIHGDITQSGPGAFAPGTFPGGLFTQPTNIGQRSANQFTVLPSAELKIGYQLTSRLRVFAGYDFMYWNQVVRPGNEIDRNINQSQSPIFGGGALVGSAAPTPLFNRTDFWAQGVNFGLELRY